MEDVNLIIVALELNLQLQRLSHDCPICWAYLVRNRLRMIPAISKAALEQDRNEGEVVQKFISGIHQRHDVQGLELK